MFFEHLLCARDWASCRIYKAFKLLLGMRVNNTAFGLQMLKDGEYAVGSRQTHSQEE